MEWIVLGEKGNKVRLVSKETGKNKTGILPKGSFITIEDKDLGTKHILRVDNSEQVATYEPSPLIIEMELQGMKEDMKCQNIINAFRLKDITTRDDGLIDYIRPQLKARRSTQKEIDTAMGNKEDGPIVLIATVQSGYNQLLMDDKGKYINTVLPIEMFYHQMIITGSTGSGKTVAMKYLSQYFAEEIGGAVLAINVKEKDFLLMDKKTTTNNEQVQKEWRSLEQEPHGVNNTVIYYPASTSIEHYRDLSREICHPVTLKVHEVDPDALIGLLGEVTAPAAQSLPDIFRFWQNNKMQKEDTFSSFAAYFSHAEGGWFETENIRGFNSDITLHPSTCQHILRKLNVSCLYFDNEDALAIDYDDILQEGKYSIINVTEQISFGSVLLRHLLKKIVDAKDHEISSVPILIVIDEVHKFYHTEASREALDQLDTICRTGRSKEIGVIFSSQNPNDIPKGLSSVVNTKIHFRSTDTMGIKSVSLSSDEIRFLKDGYAVGNIHNLPQLNIMKFPLSLAGVMEG